jgi:hypothetical protein
MGEGSGVAVMSVPSGVPSDGLRLSGATGLARIWQGLALRADCASDLRVSGGRYWFEPVPLPGEPAHHAEMRPTSAVMHQVVDPNRPSTI